jgi:mandelate racemase
MIHNQLILRQLQIRAVSVPLAKPIKTSGGRVDTAPLVLIDLETEEGIVGCAYLFCYNSLALKPLAQLVANFGELLKGTTVAPVAIAQTLRRNVRLLGGQSLTGMAIAGIDMAAWDALAKSCQLPLVRLLGGEPRPIQAYRSLGMYSPDEAVIEVETALCEGFKAVKIRLGFPDAKTDLAVVRAIRQAIGCDFLLMVDYNQCLTVPEAIKRAGWLEDEGIYWIEEPTIAEDFSGHAIVASETKIANVVLRSPINNFLDFLEKLLVLKFYSGKSKNY